MTDYGKAVSQPCYC